MWKIRDIEIPNRVVVAPMAGVSNAAFRTTVKDFGAGLVVCEMVSDKAILHNNKKTMDMLYIEPREYPLSLQIMGGEVETMVEAAKFVEENTDAAILDINMGCPVPKITKNDAGSKWLLHPESIYELVSEIVNAVDLPVTVKMRIGWDEDSIYAVENARAAEKAGASAVAMHGRTRMQMYEGEADWDILREVRQHLTIPFIGNGDVRTPQDAERMLDEVGVDAVMVGRAALGDPWIIQQIVHYLETGEELPSQTPTEKMETAVEHLNRLIRLKGEQTAAREFRKQAAYYLKGFPGAAKVKVAVNELEDPEEQIQLLRQSALLAEEKQREKEKRRQERQKEKLLNQ